LNTTHVHKVIFGLYNGRQRSTGLLILNKKSMGNKVLPILFVLLLV